MTTDGQELCQLVCIVLTSRKMVLFVPHPWHWCCCRHSWQIFLRHALQLDRIEYQHASYSRCSHNPRFHRTETWLSFTFLLPRLFLALDLLTSYVIHGSPTLWYSVRYQPQCLCLMLWPLFHHPSSISNDCLSAWKFLIPPLVSLVVFPRVKLGRDPLYPITSDNLGWLTRYPSEPLVFSS